MLEITLANDRGDEIVMLPSPEDEGWSILHEMWEMACNGEKYSPAFWQAWEDASMAFGGWGEYKVD